MDVASNMANRLNNCSSVGHYIRNHTRTPEHIHQHLQQDAHHDPPEDTVQTHSITPLRTHNSTNLWTHTSTYLRTHTRTHFTTHLKIYQDTSQIGPISRPTFGLLSGTHGVKHDDPYQDPHWDPYQDTHQDTNQNTHQDLSGLGAFRSSMMARNSVHINFFP